MRKQELVRQVAARTGQSETATTATVAAVFAVMQDALAEGDEVTISGFGSFRVVERSARVGTHPRTRLRMRIDAKKSPTFRPGARLKRAISAN
ncbi:MAG: HU family DNA-binding protein [Chloroflexota bacterium]|nr:HU family DNA-binding protein [Chloroflexota bacterium]